MSTTQRNIPSSQEDKKGIQQPSVVPKLELPKSGGAIQGIGEKYTANPATGTGNFSLSVGVTAGRGAPQLSLAYSSGSGNSPFGLGWDMALPEISRKTERNLPLYNDSQDSDTFILSGAEDLVKKIDEDGEVEAFTISIEGEDYAGIRYIPRTEGLFARIEKLTHISTKDTFWRTISGENITSIYGETPESRIYDPKNPNRIFSWLICKTFDNKGNITLYQYKQEDNLNVPNSLSEVQRKNNVQPQKYLKKILYGIKEMYPNKISNPLESDFLFQVVFDYGEHDWYQPTIAEQKTWPCRLDAFSKYRSGFENRTYRLCHRILMFHTFPEEYNLGFERLIQSTDLNYDENTNITQVNSITKVAYEVDTDSGLYVKNEMPPLEFTYSRATVSDTIQEISSENTRNTPQGLSGNYQFTDLNAEGLNGVLIETGGAWYYRRNLGDGKFDGLKTVAEKPNWSNLSGGTQLNNIESNGQLYLSQMGKNGGYSKRDYDGSWSPFRPFKQNVNIDLSNLDIRYIDLNGDGRPEMLILQDEVLHWYPNEGENGFQVQERNYLGDDEDAAPARLFQNDLEGIYLQDMCGDGLQDIVRIREHEICYWPNLGYGNFGEKVVMDNAPYFDTPGLFQPQNIRLADIDGSGTTDILYLGRHKTQFWLNHSGNGFSEPQDINFVPPIHKNITVSLVDLLGNGTACLVWSSPMAADALSPWRYIDIMNSTKPYLLTEIRNNMGSVTRSTYKPSAYFYLKDEREGRPWVTKLPFPVHLVHKNEIEDLITGHRFVSEYAYHHGYYDRAEREFRGFGYVEQWDDESFKDPKKLQPDLVYDKPRVHTKSWFHTGAWELEVPLENQFREEYWQQDNDETFFADSEFLDSGLWTAKEIQEAHRAMRGQLLRSEIYTEDDSPLNINPYIVTENRYQVKQLQAITKGNKHAVYINLPLEKVTANYDRNPIDPRIAHEMTLEIDDFGNVLKSASIAYPRIHTNSDSIPEQYELKIILSENEVFNQTDISQEWYVKGIPLSAKTSEILNFTPASAPYILRDELITALPTVNKKLLSAQVNYFRDKDDANEVDKNLITRLDFGVVDDMLLPYGTYQLIFTDDILSESYSGKLTQAEWEAELLNEKYLQETHPTKVHPDPLQQESIPGWWVTNGFAAYDPHKFYTTTRVKDVWGNLTEVEFDAIGLLPIRVEDAIGNVIKATYDYRILQPLEITDPNGSRQQVAYDGYGRVVRTAVMGKLGENNGDVLSADPRAGFDVTDSDTTIIVYEHNNWRNNQEPNYVKTYTRTKHFHDTRPDDELTLMWMEAIVYSDGFGRELQSKAKVAPGEAYSHVDGMFVEANPRWLSTGRTVYDNKGQAVKQYEPYFSTTEVYIKEESLIEWGVSPFIHYDAIGRVYQTDMPDGSFTKVEFTPWMSKTYDANDTVADSPWYERMQNGSVAEQRAAQLSYDLKDCPTIQLLDVLGRPVQTIAHNKDTVNGLDELCTTKVILDTVGNQLKVIDANGNTASEVVYDLVQRPLASISNDAGTTYSLPTIDNQPRSTWLPRGQKTRMEYDAFRRPKFLWVDEGSGEVIKEATLYGEQFSATPETHNMRGKVWKTYDGAGMAEVNEYDFKGAPLQSTRYLFADYQDAGDWTAAEIGTGIPARISSNTEDVFTTSIEYDALGRPVTNIAPDQSKTRNRYDIGGTLQQVLTQWPSQIASGVWTTHVEKISYNEKGQRMSILYGNNVRTKYRYDPLSYRLTNIHTQQNAHLGGTVIQDIDYTYDAVGNIVEMKDNAQQTVFFANQVAEPRQQFIYDGLNRLVKATGREHIGQNIGEQIKTPEPESGAIPYNNPAPNDVKALQIYTQQYRYDKVGNIQQWKHNGANGYTRNYQYQSGNNRLDTTQRGSSPATQYTYDAAGNILRLTQHIEDITWNFENQPTYMVFGTDNQAHYHYDAGGERLRKVVVNGTTRKERIYLGNYEIYRVYKNDSLDKQRNTLHIADDNGRICIVETLIVENGQSTLSLSKGAPTYRYQISNHLGSVGIELDKDGNIISYEEYHPYGTTAYYWKSTAISQKRYRYTGKERDEESGLAYHSARYYMPWLGRWLSADPAGMVDGVNLYVYCSCSPITRIDDNGKWDIEVHVYSDRPKYGYGIAILKDINGNEIFRFKIRAEGTNGTDRLKTNADTPLGVYEIPDTNMWLSGGSRKSYGPNPRLVFEGESGEIKKSGRSNIRIHGGRQEEYSNESKSWSKVKTPELKKTHGCLRAFDDDVKELKNRTDELQRTNKSEIGGKLTVVADLVEKDGQYVLPGSKESVKTVAPSSLEFGLWDYFTSWFQPQTFVNKYVPRKNETSPSKQEEENDYKVLIPYPGAAKVHTSGGNLNVRLSPGGELISSLENNSEIVFTGKQITNYTGSNQGDWAEIYLDSSKSSTGWVSMNFTRQDPKIGQQYWENRNK